MQKEACFLLILCFVFFPLPMCPLRKLPTMGPVGRIGVNWQVLFT
jgi:hypothetical protein